VVVKKTVVRIGFGLVLAGLIAAIVGAYRVGGATACAGQCAVRGKVSEYTPPVVGYRGHVVKAEICRCF
jgi:hypothetical protein